MRAGIGMVDGILKLIPAARVGHIGMYRDEETLKPVEYLVKLPADIADRQIFLVDPMLATGGSAILAVDSLKKRNAKAENIKFVCLVAAPEGVKALQKHIQILKFILQLWMKNLMNMVILSQVLVMLETVCSVLNNKFIPISNRDFFIYKKSNF